MFVVNGKNFQPTYIAATHFSVLCVLFHVSFAELRAKYLKEKQRRKELHNTLVVGYNSVLYWEVFTCDYIIATQELRGNIRVHCRVRPVLDFDKDHQHK